MNSINYKLKFAPVVLAFIILLLFTEVTAQDNANRISYDRLPDLPQESGGQMAGVSGDTLLVSGGSYFKVPVWDGGTKALARHDSRARTECERMEARWAT